MSNQIIQPNGFAVNGTVHNSFENLLRAVGPGNLAAFIKEHWGFEFIDQPGTSKNEYQRIVKADGQPITWANGEAVKEPWQYTSFLAHQFLLRTLGEESFKTATSSDIDGLPVPYWQPVDMQVFSSDGFWLVAVRSNHTRNAIGKALNLAAGYARNDETYLEAGKRELEEETCLKLSEIVADIKKAEEVLKGRPLSGALYPIEVRYLDGTVGKVYGCCPQIIQTFGVRSKFTAEQLIGKIGLNGEGAGVLVIPISQMPNLADGQSITGQFHASFGLQRMLGGNGTKVLEQGSNLSLIREKLEELRLQPAGNKTRIGHGNHGLMSAIPVLVTPEDVAHGKGYLEHSVGLAEQIELLPSRSPGAGKAANRAVTAAPHL